MFCVTNFWENLGAGLDADEAGEREAEQAFNIAAAASKITSLKHFVFSTLPKARDLTQGQRPVPHMVCRRNTVELAFTDIVAFAV